MIQLTKLTGTEIWINPDLVESVEANPDTRVHMTTGLMLIVLEDPVTVAQRIAEYRRSVLHERRSPEGAFQLIQMAEEK